MKKFEKLHLLNAAVLTDSEMKMVMGGDDITTAPSGGDITTSPWDDSTTSMGESGNPCDRYGFPCNAACYTPEVPNGICKMKSKVCTCVSVE